MIIGEYSTRRSQGEYLPIITEPEANNCFSINTYTGDYFKKEKNKTFQDEIIFTYSGKTTTGNHFVRRGQTVLTVTLNVLIIIVCLRETRFRKRNMYLVINLAVGDMFNGGFWIARLFIVSEQVLPNFVA